MIKLLNLFIILCLFGTIAGVPRPYREGFGSGDQEWGHIDVRKNAHMFYWLYYVQDPKVTNYYDKPLVVWLQGGPGSSSTGFGNFEEIGPLYLNLTERPTSWAKKVNLLFIDNPVGAGFSYVDDLSALTKNNIEIGRDMVSFFTAFYAKFPKFEKTPLYIFSESYGGKMTVEIAKQLLEAVENQKIKLNLKGVALGDSWISPIDSTKAWAPYLFFAGLIDYEGFDRLMSKYLKIEDAIRNGRFLEASQLWGSYEIDIMRETNNVDFYNIIYKVRPSSRQAKSFFPPGTKNLDLQPKFDDAKLFSLMEGPVKTALGIDKKIVFGMQQGQVFSTLAEDFMKPVTHVVEELLNNTQIKVVTFTGNLDLIVNTPGTVEWIRSLRWYRSKEWELAKRESIVLDNYIEGYVKNVGNFYLYWVNRAGHMVPTDNPETALEILRRTTEFDKN